MKEEKMLCFKQLLLGSGARVVLKLYGYYSDDVAVAKLLNIINNRRNVKEEEKEDEEVEEENGNMAI